MTHLLDARNQLHKALNQKDAALQELQTADEAYENLLKEFEAQHPEIVKARDDAAVRYEKANLFVKSTREVIKLSLSDNFINDLPEGLSQNRSKVVTFDPQGFRKQALQYFQHLLVLDEKAVNKFFTAMAEEQSDGSLILPENIRSLASVEVTYKPSARISNSTIQKLVIEVDEEDTPEDDVSPADEYLNEMGSNLALISQAIQDDDSELVDASAEIESNNQKSLVPATEDINC